MILTRVDDMAPDIKSTFAIKKSSEEVWEPESKGRGIVTRYWGCELRCPLCFAQSYAYRGDKTSRVPREISLEVALEQVRGKITDKVRWCRIEGGEPVQSSERVVMTVKLATEVLKLMGRNGRAVIQTNGIWLGKEEKNAAEFCDAIDACMSSIDEKSGKRLAIEVSFKGANSEVAKVYSGRPDIDILGFQINAFLNLIEKMKKSLWSKGRYNVSVYPVAGFGPDLVNLTFIPLDSLAMSLPLFHPMTWDQKYRDNVVDLFKQIVVNYPEVYGVYTSRHGNRMSLYGLEPRNWQKSWTSRINKDDKLRSLALKYLRVNKDQRSLNMFRSDLSELLDDITATDELIAKTREIREFYAWPEPPCHYPYL